MPFPELIAKHGMKVNGVLHVGAHLAEEAPLYAAADCGPVTWVEANARLLWQIEAVLREYPNQRLVHALVHATDGEELTLHLTGPYTGSSSVLEFGTHPTFSPDVLFVDHVTMRTRTIDSIVDEHEVEANLLVMDLQGVEGPVLTGASRFLAGVSYVLSEVNDAEVYVGCSKVWELDALLTGFDRVETHWVGDQHWGDALWVRRTS